MDMKSVHVSFDPTALKFVSAVYEDYLPAGGVALPDDVSSDTLPTFCGRSSSIFGGRRTFATVTFKVVCAESIHDAV